MNDAVEHVVPPGELDPVSAPDLERAVHLALEGGVHCIVLHLNEVEFLDSGGLHALLTATDAAERAGAELKILPGPAHVMAVIEAAGLAGRLPFVGYP